MKLPDIQKIYKKKIAAEIRSGGVGKASPVVQRPGPIGPIQTFKAGGKVKKTGLALLHKGERVIKKK